jgi:hypothetical protein
MSRLTSTPPLNAAIGVVMASGSMSMDMPLGGRPLVMANRIPASPRLRTALTARSVTTLSGVTSVPSTSARSSRMARSIGIPPVIDISTGIPGAAGWQVTAIGRLGEKQASRRLGRMRREVAVAWRRS